jgi:hypothetical protein
MTNVTRLTRREHGTRVPVRPPMMFICWHLCDACASGLHDVCADAGRVTASDELDGVGLDGEAAGDSCPCTCQHPDYEPEPEPEPNQPDHPAWGRQRGSVGGVGDDRR